MPSLVCHLFAQFSMKLSTSNCAAVSLADRAFSSFYVGTTWHEVCCFCRFPLLLPKGNIDALSTIRVRFLTPFGYGLKLRLDAVVLTSFLLQRVNCRQLSSSRLVDMADDPADNAVFYNCVPTCNHLDSEPNTFRNKFFP